jgi:hypothetical protein
MANTRNRVTANNAENNEENNNNDANLPPPPPPNLEQVLAMQAQMLQTMQLTMVNMQVLNPRRRHCHRPQGIGLETSNTLSH